LIDLRCRSGKCAQQRVRGRDKSGPGISAAVDGSYRVAHRCGRSTVLFVVFAGYSNLRAIRSAGLRWLASPSPPPLQVLQLVHPMLQLLQLLQPPQPLALLVLPNRLSSSAENLAAIHDVAETST
jgi:hypothetical protein